MAESGLVIQQVQGVTIAEIQTSSLMEGRAIEAIAKELYELVDEQDTKKLVVDFRTVGFLASQAIGILVNLHKKSKAIGGPPFMYGIGAYFAIMNAAKAFRPGREFPIHAPLTPEKLLRFLYD